MILNVNVTEDPMQLSATVCHSDMAKSAPRKHKGRELPSLSLESDWFGLAHPSL